jgi:cobalt-zinc-cadmium efflux system outer membrane protein
VRAKLRRGLVDFSAAEQAEKLLQAQLEAQAENVKLLAAQYAAGAISASEVTRERIAASTARLALEDARRQRIESRMTVASAIGVPTAALDGVLIAPVDFTQNLPARELALARRHALLNRADILAALSEYAASESALRLEIAKQYPDVHLSPGYEYDQGDNKWGIGLSVELPLFNRNRGPIAEAMAKRNELAVRFNALQAQVVAEIERAIAAYQLAQEKINTANELLDNVKQQERIARARFETGELSRSELIASQVELASSQIARLDAMVKAQQALGQLEEAVQQPFAINDTMLKIPGAGSQVDRPTK